MSLFNSFDRDTYLGEVLTPRDTQSGVLTTAQQRAKLQANIFGSAFTVNVNGNIATSGSILSSGTGGVGYSTGAGGTVTQLTSKATGVTLNTINGQITMNNASLAAGTIVSFALTDSAIAATDLIVVMHESGGTTGSYTVNGRATGAGAAAIDVRNNTAGALAEAIVLRFAVIKSTNT